ncbi:putative protein YyaL [Clostridiaceae bacterium JG1575]|nr:putative protein YyaL [Clostridiaceae bacterium JG1575]
MSPTNRLKKETSPYLLQHAENPVDWYPWGAEALERAKQEDKMIFLSVGYSTCHWCHVMARESFEDEAVAAFLNEHFIAIKVDREERPDVDHLYMEFTQQMTGQGGWPMSVFLTPRGEPIWAATYLPPKAAYGAPGFLEVLKALVQLWQKERQRVQESADNYTQSMREWQNRWPGNPKAPSGKILENMRRAAQAAADPLYGGLAGAPKFPMPHLGLFWTHLGLEDGDEEALRLAQQMVMGILRGGINDHLGGGISRYSVDERWQVPHFEKMLSDNASFLELLVWLFRATGNPFYEREARRVLQWLFQEMQSKEGLFYAALDADAKGQEGLYYQWSPKEVQDLLGPFAKEFMAGFGMGACRSEDERCLLHRLDDPRSLEDPLKERTKKALAALKRAWDGRERPHRDEKILPAWNGILLSALCDAGRLFQDTQLLQRAERMEQVLWQRFMPGPFPARTSQDRSSPLRVLSDDAALCLGEIALYEAVLEPRALRRAMERMEDLMRRYGDPTGGFMLGDSTSGLLMPTFDVYDGALPSANALAAKALQKIYALTGVERYRTALDDLFTRFSSQLLEQPLGSLALGDVLAAKEKNPLRLVFHGPTGRPFPPAFKRLLDFRSRRVSVLVDEASLADLPPLSLGDGDANPRGWTLQICREGTCERPLADPEAIEATLRSLCLEGGPSRTENLSKSRKILE